MDKEGKKHSPQPPSFLPSQEKLQGNDRHEINNIIVTAKGIIKGRLEILVPCPLCAHCDLMTS